MISLAFWGPSKKVSNINKLAKSLFSLIFLRPVPKALIYKAFLALTKMFNVFNDLPGPCGCRPFSRAQPDVSGGANARLRRRGFSFSSYITELSSKEKTLFDGTSVPFANTTRSPGINMAVARLSCILWIKSGLPKTRQARLNSSPLKPTKCVSMLYNTTLLAYVQSLIVTA